MNIKINGASVFRCQIYEGVKTSSSSRSSAEDGWKRPACKTSEFQCKNENRNQILTINDFNKEEEKCIPSNFRCDGR